MVLTGVHATHWPTQLPWTCQQGVSLFVISAARLRDDCNLLTNLLNIGFGVTLTSTGGVRQLDDVDIENELLSKLHL